MGDYKVIVDFDSCTGCGLCYSNCAYDVFGDVVDGKIVVVAEDNCVGCLTCSTNCPVECIEIKEA
jgi:NAD-dependent dihydropyrimidine dehydrogenase PreA subunit